jgi:hypothetical protein
MPKSAILCGGSNGWRREEMLTTQARVSARCEGGRYWFGISRGGPRAASGAGPKGFPEVLFLFSFLFFFFLFLFSFSSITFSNLGQNESNKFVNFSNIQLNTVRQ